MRRTFSNVRKFRNRRVASVDNLLEESAKVQNRAKSLHNLNYCFDLRKDTPTETGDDEQLTAIDFGAYPSWEELTQVKCGLVRRTRDYVLQQVCHAHHGKEQLNSPGLVYKPYKERRRVP